MKKETFIIIVLISITAFFSIKATASELDRELKIFVNQIQTKNRPKIVIGEIKSINTDKKLYLSSKIKNSLNEALRERFSVLDRSLGKEKALKQEWGNSLSGYSVSVAKYILSADYEIKKKIVQVDLKIHLVDTTELILSRTIFVSRHDVEIYLKDYTVIELDLAIEKQNKEIAKLVKEYDDEKEKLLKMQRIDQQKRIIRRIKDGDEYPFKRKRVYSYSLLMIGTISALYANLCYDSSTGLENKKQYESAAVGRTIGSVFYIVASGFYGAAGYLYYSDSDYAEFMITPTSKGISLAMSKKF